MRLEKSRHRQHKKCKDDFEEFRQIPRIKSHKSRRLQHRRNGRNTDAAALYGDERGDGVRKQGKNLRQNKHQRPLKKGGELDNDAQREVMLTDEPFGDFRRTNRLHFHLSRVQQKRHCERVIDRLRPSFALQYSLKKWIYILNSSLENILKTNPFSLLNVGLILPI